MTAAISNLRSGGNDRLPVLLLHGFGATATLTWERTGWTRALDQDGRPWLAPDLLGHGVAAKPHDVHRYREEALIDDLAATLAAHRLQRVDLMGYSFGGLLALRLADAVPGRVRRLVAGGIGSRQPLDMAAVALLRRHLDAGSDLTDPAVAMIWRAVASVPGNDPEALLALAQALSDAEPSARPSRYTGPTLLFRGADDELADGMAQLAADRAQARQLVLPGRNHMTVLTAGELKRQVLAFLDEPEPSTIADELAAFLHTTPFRG